MSPLDMHLTRGFMQNHFWKIIFINEYYILLSNNFLRSIHILHVFYFINCEKLLSTTISLDTEEWCISFPNLYQSQNHIDTS